MSNAKNREAKWLTVRALIIACILALILLVLYMTGVLRLHMSPADEYQDANYRGTIALREGEYVIAKDHLEHAFSMGLIAFPSASEIASNYLGQYTNIDSIDVRSNDIFALIEKYNDSLIPYAPFFDTGIKLAETYLILSNAEKAFDVAKILKSYQKDYPPLYYLSAKAAYRAGDIATARRDAAYAEALIETNDEARYNEDIIRYRDYLYEAGLIKRPWDESAPAGNEEETALR